MSDEEKTMSKHDLELRERKAQAQYSEADVKMLPHRDGQEIVRRNLEVLISLLKCCMNGGDTCDKLLPSISKKINDHIDQLNPKAS